MQRSRDRGISVDITSGCRGSRYRAQRAGERPGGAGEGNEDLGCEPCNRFSLNRWIGFNRTEMPLRYFIAGHHARGCRTEVFWQEGEPPCSAFVVVTITASQTEPRSVVTTYSSAQSGFNVGGPCSSSGAVPSLLHFTREDGYSDDFQTIQGARSYDNKLGQWTTMDAYNGDDMDPLSGQAYVWNRNNPIDFMDPEGDCAVTTSGSPDNGKTWTPIGSFPVPCPKAGSAPGGYGHGSGSAGTPALPDLKPLPGSTTRQAAVATPRSETLPLQKCRAVTNSMKRGEGEDRLGDVVGESIANAMENPDTLAAIMQTTLHKPVSLGPGAGLFPGAAPIVRSLDLGGAIFGAVKANTFSTCVRYEEQKANPFTAIGVPPIPAAPLF